MSHNQYSASNADNDGWTGETRMQLSVNSACSTESLQNDRAVRVCGTQRSDEVIFPCANSAFNHVGAMLRHRCEFELDRRGGRQQVLNALCTLVIHANK